MPTVRAMPYVQAIQFDGTNAQEIVDALPDALDNSAGTIAPVLGDNDASSMTILYPGATEFSGEQTLEADGWITVPRYQAVGEIMTSAEFDARYAVIDDAEDEEA